MNLGDLADRAVACVEVDPDAPCNHLDRIFRDSPDLRSVVVATPGQPEVLVNRARFYQVMTGPRGFGWSLFATKPLASILDEVAAGTMIPAETPLSEVGLRLLDDGQLGAGDDVLVVGADGAAYPLAVADIMMEVARSYAAQVEEIRAAERRFRALVQGGTDVICVLGADGRLQYLSEATEKVTGYRSEDRIGRDGLELIHPDDRAACQELLAALRERPGDEAKVTFRALRADGEMRRMEGTVRNLLHDDAVAGLVVNYRDVTHRHELEERLRHQAFHDSLTGLPNRLLMIDRAEQMLARHERSSLACAALLIDLDRFKDVNDVYGHGAGDQLLIAVAERLRLVLRRSDSVGRLGGDEFIALVEGEALDAGPQVVAQRVLDAFRVPFELDGKILSVSASIGIAVGHRGGHEELFRDADIALYEVKGSGRNSYSIYSESMKAEVERRGWLNADLPGALERGEYYLDYQPAFSLEDGRATSVEALLRWNHPERGRIAPVDFIPFLEDTGLIRPVGRWVLAESCRVAADLHRRGHAILMSVNVSARQLDHPDELHRDVVEALQASGLPAESLVLEITESILMCDADATAAHLRRLKELGVRIAIDDFGTGYSSLAYLANFPVDALKVDRSFVARLGHSHEADALLQSVLHLGQALSLLTVAEGVEHPEQIAILRQHGCHIGQGFELARPGTAEDLHALLAAEETVRAVAP